jgi:serine-type D-Ala-D-Ala carboxypeptidase (penicillin-binding protein 5/6)
MRYAALVLACGLAAVAAAAPPSAPTDAYPRAAAAYLVAVNGVPLWGRDIDRPLPPASLTKLMTALVATEDWQPEATLTVSRGAAAATGTRLGLRAGESLRLGDALDALLVVSANDACLALVEHVAGSEAAFVARMNARAAALGLAAMNFANACGFDASGHAASARDLLALARVALQVPAIAAAVAKPAIDFTTPGKRRFRRDAANIMIGRVPGAVGIKTGYTSRAGKCLIARVERGRDRVELVLLDAPERWTAADILITDAYAALAQSRR